MTFYTIASGPGSPTAACLFAHPNIMIKTNFITFNKSDVHTCMMVKIYKSEGNAMTINIASAINKQHNKIISNMHACSKTQRR